MSLNVSSEEKLNAIINGARAILEKDNFAESARVIFDYCCELTGAVSGYVALLSEDGQENELLFLEDGGLDCTVSHDLPMPIRGLRAEAYTSQKAVYDNDFMNTEWIKYLPEGHVILRNVLFAPLNLEGKTVGIIGIANKPADFNDEDARIATVCGELAAIALMNSRNIDLLRKQKALLEESLRQVRTLRQLLPICVHCKKIRDDEGFWIRVDSYISTHTDTSFSHGFCPDCLEELYPDVADDILDKK